MVRILTSLLPLLLAVGISQAGTLSRGLELQLSGLESSDELKVMLCLEDQADIATMDLDLHERAVPLAERHTQVVGTLMDTAAQTQPPLLDDLDQLRGRGVVLGYTPHWLVNCVIVRTTAAHVRELASLPGVDVVEADLVVSLIEPVSVEPAGAQRQIGIAPGIDAIEADRCWYELGITGEGAIVANMDTGVDGNHEALSARWRGNFAPASECWLDLLGSTTFPYDSYGHGSHVMGTETGLAPNDSVGAAPGALWIATNPIDQGTGSEFDNDVIAALEWFADPDGDPFTTAEVPDVAQNSWGVNENFTGYYDCDSRWWTAIDNCEAAGCVLTWSAGNEGPGGTSLRSPADRADSPTNCFSVGSTQYYAPYTISSFSSRGPSGCGGAYATKPEVVAPGSDIYSVQTGGGYTNMSGTSMAGPHAAGVVGLMRSANPDLDVITVKQIMMDTATDLGDPGEENTYGWGFINAYEAVLAAMTGYGTVEGTVTDAGSALPLESVLVKHIDGQPSTTTDDQGEYGMFLPADDHQLEFSRFGYQTQVQPVTIEADLPTVLDVAMVSVPSAELSGTVLGVDDLPLEGAQVSVPDTPLEAVITGPDGAYSFMLPIGETFTVVAQGDPDPTYVPLGPDDYGYLAFDLADGDWDDLEVTMVPGGISHDFKGENRPVYDWSTIDPDQGGPGTALSFTADDQTLQEALPFDFVYYGQSFSTVSICGNGWMAFGTTTETEYRGQPMPSSGVPNAVFAPFWEDLSPQQAASGNISTYYDAAGGRFIIEFYDIRQYTPETDFERFQAILYDPAVHETVTGDGSILFQYAVTNETDNTTVGIEDPDGTVGLQYFYGRSDGYGNPGGALPASCQPVASGLAILFTTGTLVEGPDLEPVTDLAIEYDGLGSVILSWSASAGAVDYAVETTGYLGGTWTQVDVTAATTWSTPVAGGTHLYRVIARN